MPSPQPASLRCQPSPVPTQTTFGSFWLTATAPMLEAPSLSNANLKVLPPSPVLRTPPEAEPTKKMRGSFSYTAIHETRPFFLGIETPTLRTGRFERSNAIGGETSVGGCAALLVCPLTTDRNTQGTILINLIMI